MATETQLKAWLAEAETALHALQIGEAIVQISGEGRTTIYNQNNISELKAYISDLEQRIAGRVPNAPVNIVNGLW